MLGVSIPLSISPLKWLERIKEDGKNGGSNVESAPTISPTALASLFPSIEPSMLPSSEPSPVPSSQPTCNHYYEIHRLQNKNEASQLYFSKQRYQPRLRSRMQSSTSKTLFNDYGCFYHDKELRWKSFLQNELSSSTGSDYPSDQAQDCYDLCETKHFAITSTKCYCYFDPPTQRINIESCAEVKDTCLDPEVMIDAYMKIETNDSCSQEKTKAVRNYFVEEDDAPFSYDIVSNTFRSSPFELSKDECGTNIYEFHTVFSDDPDSLDSIYQLVDYTLVRSTSGSFFELGKASRSHISSSIQLHRDDSLFTPKDIEIVVEVSGASDMEMNTLMRSPDAQNFDGRLYTSFIVKRLAEIKIHDFENKMNFVTFSDQFANLLRVYRDSDYNVFVAKEIFNKYGMFVVERGHLGGYRHIKAFFRQDEISSYGISDSDLENCFRLMSTTEFRKIDMFSYAPGTWTTCTDTVRSFILDATYDSLLVPLGNDGEMIYGDHGDTLKGGHISVGDLWQQFLVDPDDSILLTSREHYPDGDEGIKLRPITDFLVSSKISPLEVKRHLITETQFDEIKIVLRSI
ncbi:predicted protein [Chaetoceros tenuissimus]|uniref:Uncharacterized protein n=1 Tax=Chaetoceros tenuissimus TaxID=426638 RepID=A0AAD3CK90_9STRA|nr:predicted protein [Chaetoceros tenuissimus]